MFERYDVNAEIDCNIYRAELGKVTGAIYMFMFFKPVTAIRKVDNSNSEVWLKKYGHSTSQWAFKIAPNETYGYFATTNSSAFNIVEFDTSTGDVTRSKTHPSLTSSVNIGVLDIPSDSASIYFTTKTGNIAGY